MTPENEFREALAYVDREIDFAKRCFADPDFDGVQVMLDERLDRLNTIRRALLIADAVMGEPSEKMEIKGAIQVDFNQVTQPSRTRAVHCWKAMRDQMLAELDKGE